MPLADAPARRRGDDDQQQGERRTITIRGQVAPPPRHEGAYQSTARRHRPRRASERIAGSRPDRAAMWAVLLGVFLIVVAVMTAAGA
jgi:hypothetical protein